MGIYLGLLRYAFLGFLYFIYPVLYLLSKLATSVFHYIVSKKTASYLTYSCAKVLDMIMDYCVSFSGIFKLCTEMYGNMMLYSKERVPVLEF